MNSNFAYSTALQFHIEASRATLDLPIDFLLASRTLASASFTEI